MLDSLSKIFDNGYKIFSLIAVILGLLVSLGITCSKVSNLKEENLDLQNKTAELDHLKDVLKDAQTGNVTLRERNSFLEQDNIKLRINHDAVKKRLKDTDSRLLAYLESNSQLSLENQRLWGAIREGENKGEIIVDFDTTNSLYSITATVTIAGPAYLDIHSMNFFDSTYAGIRFEDGAFVGFIGHTNPLIKDKGAVFSYALQEVLPEYSPWAWRFGLGPAWDGEGRFVPAALAGFRYRSYGLAGFLAGGTKGIILTRDF